VSSAFSIANQFCAAFLNGRGGRLTAQNGWFRPGRAVMLSGGSYQCYNDEADGDPAARPVGSCAGCLEGGLASHGRCCH
jgi:hypothetical protein